MMRTKSDKDSKKTAEDKLKISLSLPRVVLDANDCAKLLDGTGGTSVIVVEKEGKMVAAVPKSSSDLGNGPLTSRRSKTPPVSTLPLPKTGKNAHFQSAQNVGSAVEDVVKAIPKSEDTVVKDIPKPPKKRRGNIMPAEVVTLNNGDTWSGNNSQIDSKDEVDSLSQKETPKTLSHQSPETLPPKHGIDNLLQLSVPHPINNNHLISGSQEYEIHGPKIQTTSLSQMSDTAHLPLSSISTSSTLQLNHTNDHSSSFQYPASSSHNTTHTSSSKSHGGEEEYKLSAASLENQRTDTSQFISGCSSSPRAGSAPVSRDRIQPEQEEPINLSTASNSAVSLLFAPSPASHSPKESKSVEDVALTNQNLFGFTEAASCRSSSPQSNVIHSAPCLSSEVNVRGSVCESVCQDQKSSASESTTTADLSERAEPKISATDNAFSQQYNPNYISVPSNQVPPSHPTSSSDHSQAVPPESLSSVLQATSSVQGNNINTSPSLHIESNHADSLPESTQINSHIEHKDQVNTHSVSGNNKVPSELDSEQKTHAKKPLKKKVEIPMDEASCAKRSALYLETIDDVIANFVYEPEPEAVEDISLTEEEEAAIKDLFVDSPAVKKAGHGSVQSNRNGVVVEVSASQSSEAHMNSESVLQSSKPPKKRAPIINYDTEANKITTDPKQTVSHIDSVLDFVASDITNSTPPMASLSSEKLEQKPSEAAPGKKKKAVKKQKSTSASIKNCEGQHAVSGVDNLVNSSLIESSQKSSVDSAAQKVPSIKKKSGKPKTGSKLDSQTMKDKTKKIDLSNTANGEGSSKAKGKTAKSKHTAPDSQGPDSNELSANVNILDKDCLSSTVRVETSDLGESVASTSGGSEQDTPIHEPETKDEMTNTDPQLLDKENQSLKDDDNKPLRRYKKRLDFVKCTQCDHQARGRSALSRHMKKVHMLEVNMPYKCQHCDYGCSKMASLNRHLFTHGIFSCSRCDFVANERPLLTEHVFENHRDKLDMKLCKVCNRYIKCDKISIEQHTEACQGPTPYKCTECEKEFKYASSLKVHYHTHFPDQPKKFKCDLCEYRTNYKANLHKHHKNMHASRDRTVQCPDCGKMFSTEDNMRRHRKVHTLVRPFSCETCKKTFKTSGALKGHQLIHTATRPFSCNFPGCSRSFRTAKFLKSHQEEFHRLVPKKFFCNVEGCNFSFFKRSHLKRHSITHTGERNYHCTWPGCSKSFRHSDNLKVHFRSHTNLKPVQCNLCDFKCKQKISLFWHKKKVHQIIDASIMAKKSDGEKGTNSSAVSEGDQGSMDSVSSSRLICENGGVETEKSSDDVNSEKRDFNSSASVNLEGGGEMDDGEADLYEFKSDGESEDETPGNFRRDKALLNVSTPLPPPPMELLKKKELEEKREQERIEREEKKEQERKEKLEKKEMEKKEKAEKKEQERKEKLEKKEQEKRERAEKKEQEKKEKLEMKEKEKLEKEEQKEKERKEKEEQKEREKREKLEQKEKEKKEKEEQKERDRKEKEEQKEKERKEKEEKKEKEKQEKLEQKEKEKQEKLAQKEKEKQEKQELKEKLKQEKERKKPSPKKVAQESKEDEKDKPKVEGKSKVKNEDKEKKAVKRKRSPRRPENEEEGSEMKTESTIVKKGKKQNEEKTLRGRKKEKGAVQSGSPPKKAKMSPRRSTPTRQSSPGASPRPATRKSPVTVAKKSVSGKAKKQAPPKRKLSARIKANKKAVAKKQKLAKGKKLRDGKLAGKKQEKKKDSPKQKKKEEKEVEKKQPVGRRGNRSSEKKDEEKKEEEKEEVKNKEEENADPKVEQATGAKIEEPSSPRPVTPEYMEENMVQGIASPYRDFSDADILEEEEKIDEGTSAEVDREEDKGSHSPDKPSQSENEIEEEEIEELHAIEEEKEEAQIAKGSEVECVESEDDEVSNDIPLTPPRAPAPPPAESSEDEMDQEHDSEPAPYSVATGPNTPVSAPGPNTPFSVPPPTNLMQQHSVHSDEAGPLSAVHSVPSMDTMHSAGSVEMPHSQGSAEMRPQGSVEMPPHGSIEMSHHGSVEMSHHGSVEMAHSVELPHHGSVELPHHGSVELPHHGSVELPHHGSVELPHHGSVELPHHGSVELPHHGSVEMQQQVNSVDMNHPHGSVELHSHKSMEAHSLGPLELQGSVESNHHNSMELPSQPPPTPSHPLLSSSLPESVRSDHPSDRLPPPPLPSLSKFDLHMQQQQHTTEADKEYFDQYLKNLTKHRSARGSSPSGLQQLEAMVDKSEQEVRELTKSPISSLPTSVITTLESGLSLPSSDLRTRMDVLVDRHDPFYTRDSASVLPRLPDRQTTPGLPTNPPPAPTPAFDTFPPLNSLHAATGTGRDSASYLRQPESLFPTPPVTSSFMAEAMFQRQAMSTTFLPQATDRSSLSCLPDTNPLRSSSSSSLLQRPSTMPGTDMFPTPTMPQAVPRHPLTNAWTGQEVRSGHWQNPYLPRQPNMTTAANPFFPSKENYLGGREFMYDPSVRPSTERTAAMFPCLPTAQTQDSFQLDRFDLSNYFPNAATMNPYGSSTGTLDYTRTAHSAAPKPFDERYHQTAAAAASAATIPDFRSALPPTTGSANMFSGINSSFNLYASGNPYQNPRYMSESGAFLSRGVLERDYVVAHGRGFYSHQNSPYTFSDERQYPGAAAAAKLGHTHATPTPTGQERDLMSRSAVPESQMQDPYRSMLYRY